MILGTHGRTLDDSILATWQALDMPAFAILNYLYRPIRVAYSFR